ncbi:hypothetical protein H0H93_007511 [Arthromyces matolae]|nr:hypothetical protein H0H93_007511 [Arthromyces matolae]
MNMDIIKSCDPICSLIVTVTGNTGERFNDHDFNMEVIHYRFHQKLEAPRTGTSVGISGTIVGEALPFTDTVPYKTIPLSVIDIGFLSGRLPT